MFEKLKLFMRVKVKKKKRKEKNEANPSKIGSSYIFLDTRIARLFMNVNETNKRKIKQDT